MKILEKIKDLFTDEVIEEKEVIIEETKEAKLPTVMIEEKKENLKKEESISDNDLFKNFENLEIDSNNDNNNNNNNNKFRFPISFEENDILDEPKISNQNIMFREKEVKPTPLVDIYPKKEEKEKNFKVSPVISPVYGILDKNYKKEEVQAKHKSSKDIARSNQKVDFESVRKKAYGSLVDDIKENLSDVKKEDQQEKELSFYELKENIDEITLGEMDDNFTNFGIIVDDYEKKSKKNIEGLINFEVKEDKKEKIDITEAVIDRKKQDDDFETKYETNDDIFNLIDNMYIDEEEKND